MAIREYNIEASFRAEDLSAQVKAELDFPADYKDYCGLSYDPTAAGGNGGFVKDNVLVRGEAQHSGHYLHDEAEALKIFERAKQEFASKRELTIRAWWDDDDGNGGELALYKQN
jgi:hypothetical protein